MLRLFCGEKNGSLHPDAHARDLGDLAQKSGIGLKGAGDKQGFVGIAAGQDRGGQVFLPMSECRTSSARSM